MSEKSLQHLNSIGVNDVWETPDKKLIDACKDYHVNPILDVCCTKENAKCITYFAKEETDALSPDVPWNRDFFMNPPYSEIEEWMKKAYWQSKMWNVDGLCLIFSKTDTKWWHEYVEEKAEVHFIRGRMNFLMNGKPHLIFDKKTQKWKNGYAPYPSAWVIYRKNA